MRNLISNTSNKLFNTVAGALALVLLGPAASPASAAEVNRLYIGVGTTSAEFWANFVSIAEHVAKSANPNIKVEVFQSDFQGQKLLSQFGGAFAGGCDDCIVIADPASNAFTKAIVDRAADAGAKIVTIWNRPEEIHPWDTQPENWVAHISYDGVSIGYENGMALCKALNGKGNIVALQGVPDNPTAKQRLAGLQKALTECPGMKLLDTQSANWSAAEAQTIVRGWMSRFGQDLNGIYSSNDGMGIGAIAALREQGLAGKIPVTGADGQTDFVELIKKGEALSTMSTYKYNFAAIGTGLAYAAASGDIDLSKLSHEQRDFYVKQQLITKDNADEELARRKQNDMSDLDYEKLKANFWLDSAGPIPDGSNQ